MAAYVFYKLQDDNVEMSWDVDVLRWENYIFELS